MDQVCHETGGTHGKMDSSSLGVGQTPQVKGKVCVSLPRYSIPLVYNVTVKAPLVLAPVARKATTSHPLTPNRRRWHERCWFVSPRPRPGVEQLLFLRASSLQQRKSLTLGFFFCVLRLAAVCVVVFPASCVSITFHLSI